MIGNEHLQRTYKRLDLAVTIGNALKSGKSLKSLLILLNDQMRDLMSVYCIGIACYDSEKDYLKLMYILEDGSIRDDVLFDLKRHESFNMKTCVRKGESVIFRTRDDNKSDRLPDYKYQEAYEEIQSAMYVPIVSGNLIKGVLTVQSKMTYEYNEEDLKLLEVISAYFSQLNLSEG